MRKTQQGPRAICILSANGVISSVTLRQSDSSGGTLTYEGRFEILSLTGSFMPSKSGGMKNRSGGMSVSVASPDGRVMGGGVAGLLVAASPVQTMERILTLWSKERDSNTYYNFHGLQARWPFGLSSQSFDFCSLIYTGSRFVSPWISSENFKHLFMKCCGCIKGVEQWCMNDRNAMSKNVWFLHAHLLSSKIQSSIVVKFWADHA